MLLKIVLVFAVLIAVFLIIVALQPATFSVERTKVIAAPPDKPFALVNDFHEWTKWSPWEGIDPAMKRTYEGPPAGIGAKYSWEGNDQVGSGGMTMTESQAPNLISLDLVFLKPMQARNVTVFKFEPEGAGTRVTWTMSGTKNFVSKGFCMFMNMDKMVGGDFEKGLEKMKTVAESTLSAP